MLACNSNQLLDLGDNGGPTFEAHSNAPLRGGKLNFFEGGIRPACFVHSPLLKIRASGGEGVVYTGILHTTDWFATFAALSGASLPSPDDPSLAINGIDAWPVFTAVARDGNRTMDSNDRFVDAGARQEALIADNILRAGNWKLVTGGDRKGWANGFCRDCMLGTGGGWLTPPDDQTNNTNLCPLDIYTRAPKDGANATGELGCAPNDVHKDPGLTPVTSPVDKWLCGPAKKDGVGTHGSCTPQQPCLWDVVADPAERQEVARSNPKVVATLTARLAELSKGFAPDADFNETGDFCAAAKLRNGFCGPWVKTGKQEL